MALEGTEVQKCGAPETKGGLFWTAASRAHEVVFVFHYSIVLFHNIELCRAYILCPLLGETEESGPGLMPAAVAGGVRGIENGKNRYRRREARKHD